MAHEWNTVNREVHEPAELSVADVVEEIRVALATWADRDASGWTQFVEAIDKGHYHAAGTRVAHALRDMNGSPKAP